MIKNCGNLLLVVLLTLVMGGFACAEALTTSGREAKQQGNRKAVLMLSQNDQSDEGYNVKFSDGKSRGITKFEKVPADEEHIINELRKAVQNQTSPLDVRYWSTTPYLCGSEQAVKYSLIPTSHMKSALPAKLTEDYLTDNMEKHLASHEASFDFMIQVQKDPDRMPVEDAGVEWSEKESPFIKVATLRIYPQAFRTKERDELAENLSFSPAHSLIEHRPIGGINRARVEIYRHLSEFRHKQNNKHLVEPSK